VSPLSITSWDVSISSDAIAVTFNKLKSVSSAPFPSFIELPVSILLKI